MSLLSSPRWGRELEIERINGSMKDINLVHRTKVKVQVGMKASHFSPLCLQDQPSSSLMVTMDWTGLEEQEGMIKFKQRKGDISMIKCDM